MRLPIYQIDAFASEVFRGNPAAVIPLDEWPADAVLQSIAAENNLSETAFILGGGGRYHLRWFTPRVEVKLCGHATLASAYVVFRFLEPDLEEVVFDSRSGPLPVRRSGEWLSLDFPIMPPGSELLPAAVAEALRSEPVEVYRGSDLLAVFRTEAEIRSLTPDMALLEALGRDYRGMIVTAPGEACDFVSRFFAPAVGIPEDPVTGSAHCTLAAYWAQRLGKNSLEARQVSQRGGEIRCEVRGDRVLLSGQAALYLEGVIRDA